MADLKLDLINQIKTKKYYQEIELSQLAQNPNIPYEEKINTMIEKLYDIALLNSGISLSELYFQPQPQQNPQQSNGGVHPGQTHAE